MNAKMLFQKSKNNKTRLPLIIYNEWDHKKLKQLAIYLDKELCLIFLCKTARNSNKLYIIQSWWLYILIKEFEFIQKWCILLDENRIKKL